jgi:hypothetical protein
MPESPSKLQAFNNDLVSSLHGLQEKRDLLQIQNSKDCAHRETLSLQQAQLSTQLQMLNSKIDKQTVMIGQFGRLG